MKRNILIFALLITALLILFRLGKFQLIRQDTYLEFVTGGFAIVFFFLGLYFRKKWSNQNASLENQTPNYAAIKRLGLSDREQEVLQELVGGFSNKEIGDRLFVSESTVKSHVSSIYSKLEVNRRPQAILKAKQLGLVENSEISTKV